MILCACKYQHLLIPLCLFVSLSLIHIQMGQNPSILLFSPKQPGLCMCICPKNSIAHNIYY